MVAQTCNLSILREAKGLDIQDWGWRDGSGDKVFGVQLWGPGFALQDPSKMKHSVTIPALLQWGQENL